MRFVITIAVVFVLVGIWHATEASDDQQPPDELIDVVAKAAERRDFSTLETVMSDDFLVSFGHERSRNVALAWYREHPEILDKLREISSWDCTFMDYSGVAHYVCPMEAADQSSPYYGYRAGFRFKSNGTWEFAWFVAGD